MILPSRPQRSSFTYLPICGNMVFDTSHIVSGCRGHGRHCDRKSHAPDLRGELKHSPSRSWERGGDSNRSLLGYFDARRWRNGCCERAGHYGRTGIKVQSSRRCTYSTLLHLTVDGCLTAELRTALRMNGSIVFVRVHFLHLALMGLVYSTLR